MNWGVKILVHVTDENGIHETIRVVLRAVKGNQEFTFDKIAEEVKKAVEKKHKTFGFIVQIVTKPVTEQSAGVEVLGALARENSKEQLPVDKTKREE